MRSRFISFLLMIAVLLSVIPLAACKNGAGKHGETEAPATAEPKDDPTYTHLVCYWPEEADYESCDYALIVEKPEFSRAVSSGYAFNQAVDRYINELSKRIERDYLPSAVAKPPYTQVNCDVDRVGNVTNVVFTELHCYEAQPYSETYVLMLDERGNEVNLCDLLLDYHAENLAAKRIAELIKGRDGYYEADESKVLASIDSRHGVRATEDGCIVYIHSGMLAPYEEGELAFSLGFDEVAPDFIGEDGALSALEYRRLTEFLGMVADSVIVRESDVVSGVMPEFAATLFMSEAARKMDIRPEAGRINIPSADFESYYRRCFNADFPGIDREAHDIRLENGVYAVLSSNQKYSYHIDFESAERTGDELTVTGDVVFGDFGYAFSEPVCHVRITLLRDEQSPFGFVLKDFKMQL